MKFHLCLLFVVTKERLIIQCQEPFCRKKALKKEIAIHVHSAIEATCKAYTIVDFFINFESFISAFSSSMFSLKQ
jgi:hypothetical protein